MRKGEINMIIRRELLCAKVKEKLDLGRILLYEPYKNILVKFKELRIDINAKDFDPVAKVYDGLLSVPSEIREYYEALLGVTSYYHHSQGGRGKYLEKKIASSFETCSLDIELSKLPFWLEQPSLHKKKGIFTQQGLSSDEKKILRTIEWDWIGDRDVNTDVGSVIQDKKTIVLVELKNRVDTGGVAGRREIWTSEKFGIFVEYLKSNKKLFRKNDKKFSLAELLKSFGIENLEIYIGILFDKGDNPATVKSDKVNGFYSSSKQGFEYLQNLIKQNSKIKIIGKDSENLQIKLGLTYSNLKVKIGALYGNDITLKLFRKSFPVSDLLLLRYDDIWLSQLITIDERAVLLKHKNNYTLTFLDLLKRDKELRIKYDTVISSECGEPELKEIVKYLFDKYIAIFEDKLLPDGEEKTRYLADVIQVLCAAEA
ncbi:MAG: hypothetical protein AUJ85_06935 [Elusimicrobia bacterium CG1_02_37_114]|nr:MAG: hypothetical protein AUJ85_06935 [Elusimicrobia bacterium CG1_02_37_114]PIV52527.1 MAG: hypothetical protein COS17_08790 [Elusimicrobia bacterium CG02_land_8_20_14_3_00_37_13]PIZ13802.1 MAG: hypothetical protein COY53_02950 [Elusimicrobia bacterium CG_4_10_14_0_8_um_filter_37_32]